MFFLQLLDSPSLDSSRSSVFSAASSSSTTFDSTYSRANLSDSSVGSPVDFSTPVNVPEDNSNDDIDDVLLSGAKSKKIPAEKFLPKTAVKPKPKATGDWLAKFELPSRKLKTAQLS